MERRSLSMPGLCTWTSNAVGWEASLACMSIARLAFSFRVIEPWMRPNSDGKRHRGQLAEP
jgi:hypothetical protein